MKYRGIVLGLIIIVGVFLIYLSQKDKMSQIRRAVVGLDAPEFTFLDKSGTQIKLSALQGKTVFVHFWASWCKECREEMPEIQALYERKKSNPNFVFLSVIYREDPKVTRQWLRDNNFDIPLYIDKNEKAARDYGLTGVPETFIIDPNGVLEKRILGPSDWDKI